MPTNNASPAEHFDDIEQQTRAGLIGIWLFLATELLLFGGLFSAFTLLRVQHTDVFAQAATHLDLKLASINTAILLTSGFTMVLAEQGARLKHSRPTLIFLTLTILLGLVFLGIKGHEWQKEFHHNLMPILDLPFHFPGQQPDIAELFFNLYFIMTGLHAAHMLIGLFILGYFLIRIARQSTSPNLERQLRVAGLYWAFVDVVWVFVFTTLYLLRG